MLDGCRSKAHSSKSLNEARLFIKVVKCDTNETYVNIDRT